MDEPAYPVLYRREGRERPRDQLEHGAWQSERPHQSRMDQALAESRGSGHRYRFPRQGRIEDGERPQDHPGGWQGSIRRVFGGSLTPEREVVRGVSVYVGRIFREMRPSAGSNQARALTLISRQSRGPHRARLRGGVESPRLVRPVSSWRAPRAEAVMRSHNEYEIRVCSRITG